MKKQMSKMDKWFSAITFAQAGDHETALSFVGGKKAQRLSAKNFLNWFERTLTAVTFAEHDCPQIARSFLKEEAPKVHRNTKRLGDFMRSVGLHNVRCNYGYLVVN